MYSAHCLYHSHEDSETLCFGKLQFIYSQEEGPTVCEAQNSNSPLML